MKVNRGLWPVILGLTLRLGSPDASAEPPPQQEFSADIVTRDATGAPVGAGVKLYVANGKVRIEAPDHNGGFFLVDSRAANAFYVRPSLQFFTDAPRSNRLTQIFIPVNPNNPCLQWQTVAVPGAEAQWRCEATGAALIDGHSTTEFRVTSPDRQTSRRWIDPSLQFTLRLRMTDGATVSLEHIRVEAQSPGLFTLAPAYRKLDPKTLIERMKHSDVWVEPPK